MRYQRFLALFLAVIVLGIGTAEYILRAHVFDGTHNALLGKRVAAVYEQRPWPVLGDSRLGDVLIGDSQIKAGFVVAPKYFSFALSGEPAPMLQILVEQYFKFRPVGRVIIEAAPQLFAETLVGNGTRDHDKFFAQNNWLQHRLGVRLYVAEPGVENFIGEAISSLLVRYHIFAPDVPQPFVGPVPKEHWGEYSEPERETFAQLRVQHQQPTRGFTQRSYFEAYERMVRGLLAKGARVCLLRTPVTAEYLEASKGNSGHVQADARLRDLAKAHNLPYVDFRDLPMDFKPEYFVFQDHLNAKGAEIFAPLAERACFPPNGGS